VTVKFDFIPWAHKLYVGTGHNPDTAPWSIVNPTQNIDLKDFPKETECFYTLINFTNLSNRLPLNVAFVFKRVSTGETLFTYVHTIPATSTYWGWYSAIAWIGHFDWEINRPEDYSCDIHAKLGSSIEYNAQVVMHVADTTPSVYENPQLQTPEGLLGWIWDALIEPVLQAVRNWFNANVLPIWKLVSEKFMGFLNWVLSLVGSVADFISEKIKGFLDWVTEGFKSFAKWITDIGGNLVKWLQDNIGGILTWITDGFLGFVKWLGEIGGNLFNWLKDNIGSFLTWVTEGFLGFVKWLQEIGGSIVNYISESISSFVDWTQEQLGSIWKGLETLVGGWIEGLVKAFFQGLNIGINESGNSPLDTKKETDNQIMQGLQKYMIKYREERDNKKVK
jgi:hypothetical protein